MATVGVTLGSKRQQRAGTRQKEADMKREKERLTDYSCSRRIVRYPILPICALRELHFSYQISMHNNLWYDAVVHGHLLEPYMNPKQIAFVLLLYVPTQHNKYGLFS